MSGFKIDVKNEKNRKMDVFRMVAVYMVLLALTGVCFSVFKISTGIIKISIILIPVVIFSYFMVEVSKHRRLRLCVFFGIMAGVLVFGRQFVIEGIDFFVSCFSKLESSVGNYESIEKTAISNEFLGVMFIILVVFAMIFSMILLAKRMLIVAVLIMILPVMLVSGTGYLLSITGVCMLLVSGMIYIVCYHEGSRELSRTLTGVLVCLTLLMAISVFLVPEVEKIRNEHDGKYQQIRESLRNLDCLDLQKIISNIKENRGNYTKGGVGKGNLKNLTNCKSEGTQELEVTLSQRPTSTVYLKAFVGTTYTGEQWEELGQEALIKLNQFAGKEEQQKELLNEPYNKLDKIREINKSESYSYDENGNSLEYYAYNPQSIKINILNNHDEIGYFPYFSQIINKTGINQDSYINGEGRKEYKYSCYTLNNVNVLMQDYEFWKNSDRQTVHHLIREMPQKSRKVYESKTELWKKYAKFVGEECTEYPKELTKLTDFCNQMEGTVSVDGISSQIDELFQQNMEYSMSPGTKPKEKDFIEYFIENGKGFCVHFASTATLIYRKFGYPARYVEGYAISPYVFKEQKDGTYKAVVTDNMAHAWCELFDNNMGWMVEEHTLGYNNSGDGIQMSVKRNLNVEAVTAENPTTHTPETKERGETATTTDVTGSNGKSVNHNNDIKIHWSMIPGAVIRILILIFVLLALCVVQCGIRINHKIRKFKKRKNNAGIQHMYNEIFEICRFCGLKTDGKNEEEVFEQIKNNFSQLSDEEWQWIYECALNAAFSGKECDRMERKKMYYLMTKFKKKVWTDLSIRKKFIFKYIKAM